jgi:hypothetical protein
VQAFDHPADLVASRARVVVEACGAQRGDARVRGEVGVHPGQALRIAEPLDERVRARRSVDVQGHLVDLEDRKSVVV